MRDRGLWIWRLDYTHVYITPSMHPSVQDTVITKCVHCTISTLGIQRYVRTYRGHNLLSCDISVGTRGEGHQGYVPSLED